MQKVKRLSRSSWRWKICIIFTCEVIIVCTGSISAFYYYAQKALFNEIRDRLAFVANSIALQINAKEHESLQERKDESTHAYKRIKALLARYKIANPEVRYLYTMRPRKNSNVWEFVVDAEENPKLVSHIGDEYDVSQLPELRAGLLHPTADKKATHDRWGDWVSGYAPIRDKSGRSVGIVGVDVSVKQVERKLAQMRLVGILCLLLSIVFSGILTWLSSEIIFLPVKRFVNRLNAVVRGELSRLTDDNRNDEIGQVASAFNEILQMLENKDEMLSRINIDYLTGLYNHGYFQTKLEEEIKRAEERLSELALLMLDIDRFKLINDSLGHLAGDEILRQLANLLKRNLHDKDVLARYGGEEFAVILPGEGLLGALKTAERIRKATSAHTFKLPMGLVEDAPNSSISLTVSIGVAVYPHHSREKKGLIMAADTALYQAKRLGRDRVCAYKTGSGIGKSDPSHVSVFLQDPTGSAIKVLADAIDARDPYTRTTRKM